MPAPFYSRENPAALPFIKNSSLSLYQTSNDVQDTFGEDWPITDDNMYILDGLYGPGEDTRFAIRDNNRRMVLGYQTPVGNTIGISIEAFKNNMDTVSQEENYVGQNYIPIEVYGVVLSAGWVPIPGMAIGAGCTLGSSGGEITYQGAGTIHEQVSQFLYALEIGFLLKNKSSSFIYSLYGGWTNQIYYISDLINQERPIEDKTPAYIDQTITLGVRNNKTFLVSKTIMDLSLSNSIPHYFQPILAVENWFTSNFSARMGTGYFFTLSDGTVSGGIGGNVGGTIILFDKWELDLSATYRKRPTTVAVNELVPEIVMNVGISWLNPF